MKPNNKKFDRRLSVILYNEFENNKNNINNEHINELIKNTELYQKIMSIRRNRIIFFYKLKYSLKKKLVKPFLDTTNNYNKMMINNILSNKVSNLKLKYTEMLYEIETNDLIIKLVQKGDIYYMLKYLVVINDKCHIQYPNYLKDINVYYFMSKYLLTKQKFFDRIKDNNNYNYMYNRIKKLFYTNNENDKKIFASKISHSDSDEDLTLKQKRGQGGLFNIDMDNSQDSLNKLQLLVGKISDNFESTKANKIFLRARSKSFRNIDTLLLKYSNSPKTKQIRRVSLYDINIKKIIRNKKRRGTEIKFDRKKVAIDKVVIKDETKNRNKKKKATKAEIKQHLIEKRNEINEIKRLILSNDIGKNNRLLDVVKRGFAFINDKSNKDLIKNKINKKIEEKKIVKIDENETESNKVLIIKEKIRNLIENKNIFDLCNRDNNNLFKNKKNIFQNLNNGLNEFRFYNKANDNSIEKYKYYERKVIPGLFNNKVNKLFVSQNEKMKTTKLKIFLGTMTPVRKKYSNTSGTYCKRYSKLNNILFDNSIKKNKNKLYLHMSQKKEKNYLVDSILINNNNEEQSTKIFNNKLEREENSIYKYYKTTIKERKTPLLMYKLNHFKNIRLIDEHKIKTKINNKIKKQNNNTYRFLINHTEQNNNSNFNRKMEAYMKNMKNNKETNVSYRMFNTINNNNIRVINKYSINSKNNKKIIKIKGENNQEINVSKSQNQNDNRYKIKNKMQIKIFENVKRKLMKNTKI